MVSSINKLWLLILNLYFSAKKELDTLKLFKAPVFVRSRNFPKLTVLNKIATDISSHNS